MSSHELIDFSFSTIFIFFLKLTLLANRLQGAKTLSIMTNQMLITRNAIIEIKAEIRHINARLYHLRNKQSQNFDYIMTQEQRRKSLRKDHNFYKQQYRMLIALDLFKQEK